MRPLLLKALQLMLLPLQEPPLQPPEPMLLPLQEPPLRSLP